MFRLLEQRRTGLPPWWIEVLESKPHPHTNLIVQLPAGTAERIAVAPAYEGHVDAQPVTDMAGLTVSPYVRFCDVVARPILRVRGVARVGRA